jgi:hypothetical protein
MSDETPVAEQTPEGQDRTRPPTPPQAPKQQQQEVDWAKRYSDLQPEYTRTTQELSQLRQREDAYKALLYSDDQDTRQQAAQALGIELADDEVDDTQYDDPTDALRAELEQLKQTVSGDLTARQQQEQIASLEAAAESSMDTLQVPKDEAVAGLARQSRGCVASDSARHARHRAGLEAVRGVDGRPEEDLGEHQAHPRVCAGRRGRHPSPRPLHPRRPCAAHADALQNGDG